MVASTVVPAVAGPGVRSGLCCRVCGIFTTVKWQRLGVLGVVALFACSSGSGDGGVPEETAIPPNYFESFTECVDTAEAFLANQVSLLANWDDEGDECRASQTYLLAETVELKQLGLKDFEDPYATFVWGSFRAVDRFVLKVEFLAEQWQDCFAEVGQRLQCLDLIISSSDNNNSEYEGALKRAGWIVDLLPQFADYVNDAS